MILTYLIGFILSWCSCEVASGITCSEWKGKKRYWKFMVDERDLWFVVKCRKWSNKIKLLSDIESWIEVLIICMVKCVKLIKYVFSFRITQKHNEQ